MFSGDESLADALRRMVHQELVRYKQLYLESEEKLANNVGMDFTAFSHCILSPDSITDQVVHNVWFDNEIQNTLTNGRWSSIIHVFCLATILQHPYWWVIFSKAPGCIETYIIT